MKWFVTLLIAISSVALPASGVHFLDTLITFDQPTGYFSGSGPYEVIFSPDVRQNGPSGPYLGDFGNLTVDYFAMDAVSLSDPEFDSGYPLRLSFDIVTESFPATAGGSLSVIHSDFDPSSPGSGRVPKLIYSTTVGLLSTLEHHQVDFTLQKGSNFGVATDMYLDFKVENLTGATWGIDNFLFVLAPEPSTGALVAAALGSIALARRAHRRH